MNEGAYRTILVDPPWPQTLYGHRKRAKGGAAKSLTYPVMSVADICALPVGDFAAEGCHLWLWTTNQFIRDGFNVMDAWGFKYLAPIHWIKPSGIGCWFVHRTQTLLFGYRGRCEFNGKRYLPNLIQTGDPVRHSQKPGASYSFIESVSDAPRLELFARQRRLGWDAWGDEVECSVSMEANHG